MSTDYYVHSALSQHTLARASQVNAQFAAVETGLALLPGKDEINESRITYVADTGAADAYVVTLSPVPLAYTAGMTITVKMSAINTGACTINVNGLGARAIKLTDGSDPGSGNIIADGLTELVYDGTSFVIMSVIPGGVSGNYNPAAVAITGGTMDSVTITGGSITGGSISGITDLAVADGGTGSSTAGAARTALGLAIGSDVQGYDDELAALAGLTSAADKLPYFTGAGAAAVATFTAFARTLVDDADAAAVRTTLGLDSMAIQGAGAVAITGGSISGITDLAVADGGTGASDAATARTNLGAQTLDATLTSIAAVDGVAGDILYASGTDAWARLAKGADGEVVKLVSGLPAYGSPFSSNAAQATTSGGNKDFTGVRAGANLIMIMLDQVSMTGVNDLLVRIGDSGGFESAGYDSGASVNTGVAGPNGFQINDSLDGANIWSGIMTLVRIPGSNTWVGSGDVHNENGNFVSSTGGRKTLSGELTQFQLVIDSTSTFDNGQVAAFIM